MTALPFVFPSAPIFWLTFAWVFWPEFRITRRAAQSVRRGSSVDAGSHRVIILGMWVAMVAAFPLASAQTLRFPEIMQTALFIVGVTCLISGSLLRRHCWRILGTSFTGDVQARVDQRIVSSGAYRLLRHPAYTGGILIFGGIGLALGSWASTALLVVSSVVVYSYRMAVEERALLSALGEPYRQFMRTRKRLVPYVY